MNKIVFFPTNNIGKFERYKSIIGQNKNGEEVMLSDLLEEERNQYLSQYTNKVAKFVNENMLFNKE